MQPSGATRAGSPQATGRGREAYSSNPSIGLSLFLPPFFLPESFSSDEDDDDDELLLLISFFFSPDPEPDDEAVALGRFDASTTMSLLLPWSAPGFLTSLPTTRSMMSSSMSEPF